MSLSHIGKKLSEEHKEKIRLANSGEKGNSWKGGITPINKLIRGSAKYDNWRIAVFEKDNYTCQLCGDRSGKGKGVYLHAHHIKSFKSYPELRFEVSNGITYCDDCHSKTDNYKNKRKIEIAI